MLGRARAYAVDGQQNMTSIPKLDLSTSSCTMMMIEKWREKVRAIKLLPIVIEEPEESEEPEVT